MITIASKSILEPIQIQDKVSRGSHFMEVHLMNELSEHTPEEFYDICDANGCFDMIEIVSIHSPLMSGHAGGDTLIEKVTDYSKLLDTFRFAELVAKRQGYPIRVVVHASTNPRILGELGALEPMLMRVRNLLKWYPDVILSVENHVGYDYESKTRTLMPVSTLSLLNGEPELANCAIVEAIDHPRCNVLIDTVHLTMLARWLRQQAKFLADEYMMDVADSLMSVAVAQSVGKLEHVHFAKAISHGYGPDFHGQGFYADNPADVDEAYGYLKEMLDGGFDSLIVIETYEKDYLVSENFSATLDTITSILDRLGVEYRF